MCAGMSQRNRTGESTQGGLFQSENFKTNTNHVLQGASNKHVHFELLVVANPEKCLEKHLSIKEQKNKVVHSYLTQ